MSDLYMVRGSYPMNRWTTITRNMAVIRHDGELSLVNPIRLDEKEEARLMSTGKISRLIRLGPAHGADDPYYIEKFGAELWTPGESRSYPLPQADVVFDAATEMPFPDARLLVFKGTQRPEAVMLVEREGGILLTCDSLQHYGDYRFNSFMARMFMPFIGFKKDTVIGPIWRKFMEADAAVLEQEFCQLLNWEFRLLLSAHGSLSRNNAHERVRIAIERAYV